MVPGTRIWLDDVRPEPAGWTRAKTAREAIALLEAGGVEAISLDHDLGDETTCGTGYEVTCWIEEAVATRGFVPPTIHIHSANVVGRERMQRAIESIERFRAKGSVEMMAAAHVVRIVSGGQTGADRGGLDAALALGIEHGGWCPAGRRAEDGQVPRVYALRETTSAEYAERTKANVRDSDGTVVFTRGAATGGSALTLRAARRLGKPVLHLDLAKVDGEAAAERVRGWCVESSIAVLNVAGSRESKAPGIGDDVRQLLLRALGAPREGSQR
ncbi:MAG: YpsA SLOG family protein [Polyangiaceae bacterium]